MSKHTAQEQLKARKKKLIGKLPNTLSELIELFVRQHYQRNTPPARREALLGKLKLFGQKDAALSRGMFDQLRQGHLLGILLVELLVESVKANAEAAQAVVEAIHDESDIVRHYVVTVLGIVLGAHPKRGKEIGALPPMYLGLGAASAETRVFACSGLGDFVLTQRRADADVADVLSRLLPLLADTHSAVRQEAAVVIGRCGAAAGSAIPNLRGLLADSDPDVRSAARRALETIAWEQARQPERLLEPGTRIKIKRPPDCSHPCHARLRPGTCGIIVGRDKHWHTERGWKLLVQCEGDPYRHLFYEDDLESSREDDIGSLRVTAAQAA